MYWWSFYPTIAGYNLITRACGTFSRIDYILVHKKVIIKRETITNFGENWKTETFTRCWWTCKMVKSFWKTVWHSLKKLTRVTKWPRNSTYKYILKRVKDRCPFKYLYMNIHRTINYSSPKVKAIQMSNN
jgi:hypothetical protein